MLAQTVLLIQHYGLLGIFISHVIENVAVPFPTEGAFLVSLELIKNGQYSFWSMYWFIVVAQVSGAVIGYGLGRFLEEQLVRWLSRSKKFVEAKDKIHGWYDKYGSITVLATRLIGYVRPWSSLIAGFAEFPIWSFLLWTIIGTMIFVYPTLKITAILALIWTRYPGLQPVIAIAMLLSFFGWVLVAVYHRVRRRRAA